MVQLDGRPVPAAMKPNETEPPTGTMAFQPALANEKCCPEPDRTESQLLLMLVPGGRSNATVQSVTSPGPSFVTVYLPSYPVLQLEVWTNVARAPAANAG
jgi:hypothetical protein